VPHNEKRFPGYDPEEKQFSAEVHRKHIMGQHVADYMRQLLEEDEEAYKRQFSQYIKHGITPDELENVYTKCHAAIRAKPEAVKREVKKDAVKKRVGKRKLDLAARRNKIAQRKTAVIAALDAGGDE